MCYAESWLIELCSVKRWKLDVDEVNNVLWYEVGRGMTWLDDEELKEEWIGCRMEKGKIDSWKMTSRETNIDFKCKSYNL